MSSFTNLLYYKSTRNHLAFIVQFSLRADSAYVPWRKIVCTA